ncbi:MAG: putative membrane protein [Methanobacteriota archaeon]|jgi:uncharacterized membrane protein
MSGSRAPRPSDGDVSTYTKLRKAFLTGVSIVVPAVVTLYVLKIAFDFLFGALSPLVGLIEGLGAIGDEGTLIAKALALVLLVGAIFAVGSAMRLSYGERAVGYFDEVVEAVPGIGAVYTSFRQMGDVLLDGDAESFREVYLVEFPYDGCYVVGFQTSEPPESFEDATGEDMVTLFLPLAPNPMMGGFLAHMPKENVVEVDMTVEEGVRSVATLGIGVADDDETGVDDDIDVKKVLGRYEEKVLNRDDDERNR